MVQLEDLTRGVRVKGIILDQTVTVIDARWHGEHSIELTYKDAKGNPHTELVYRDGVAELEVVAPEKWWSFDGDGKLLRLVLEAQRIRLAYLFDPLLAVHTSLVEPLPHQITAVYGEMLHRQPLRFLLADDPGSGKTIMAGLLIRELWMRGDLRRCLIVCPGSLAAQWQDELEQKFHLSFEMLTPDRGEGAVRDHGLAEMSWVIVRLDQLSRSEDLQGKIGDVDWDLVVVDEAHKMSASVFGGEVKETKRYKLGKLLSTLTRHFLLMTATPHNGKEADFQLFLALLDRDRFEGQFREGVHGGDPSDLMRRLVKEDLVKFDGKPLFPERRAHTVQYTLSRGESRLYQQVTDYVREEFNRADGLSQGGRKGTVGFALTVLQRRLASSPEAIYQSLRRRRERLTQRLQEELAGRAASSLYEGLDGDEGWGVDEEDLTAAEWEAVEAEVVDLATAAQTIAQLQGEIDRLGQLEALALQVRRSGKDRKWEELSRVIQMVLDRSRAAEILGDTGGLPPKLVIFTEHRDTLNYLGDQITTLLGRSEGVVTIHGSMGRKERKRAEAAFKQDGAVQVLIATDAAGEGINLQQAHLMVNYDLPWNPNRLEQRFGRIHRIGQTEVCHLWNLVAEGTREGDVYLALLKKLDIEQRALGGKVFDVLGQAIAGKELRELLIEAIRYGDRPAVKAKLHQVVQDRLDHSRLQALGGAGALGRNSLDMAEVQRIRADMERATARDLQPYGVGSFFLEAFQHWGGVLHQREPQRYEVTHVPAVMRQGDRKAKVLMSYERICFEKEQIHREGKPSADFICPGHPLLDSTIAVILDQSSDLLRQGATLVDDQDPGERMRVLVCLEHSIQDGQRDRQGQRRVVSRQMQYVEVWEPTQPEGSPDPTQAPMEVRSGGDAPYGDYRPITPEELALWGDRGIGNFGGAEVEEQALVYGITQLVPQHLQEVRQPIEALNHKTLQAVRDRLSKEIKYWDEQAGNLQADERAGKPNAKINSAKARQRADELEHRLHQRTEELKQQGQLSALPPVVVGAALVVPRGLLQRLQGKRASTPQTFAQETQRVETLAMEAVMATERALGHQPRDVSADKCGYDIASIELGTGHERCIEVKGRIKGADTVTVTKNEIKMALEKRERYILALVEVPIDPNFTEGDLFAMAEQAGSYHVGGEGCRVRYVIQPFEAAPDWSDLKAVKDWRKLWDRGYDPCG